MKKWKIISLIGVLSLMAGCLMSGCASTNTEKEETESTKSQNVQTQEETESSKKQAKDIISVKEDNVENIFVYHGKDVENIKVTDEKGKRLIQLLNQTLSDEENSIGLADGQLLRKGNGVSLDLREDEYWVEIALKKAVGIQYAGWNGTESYKNVLSIQLDFEENLICVADERAKAEESIAYGTLIPYNKLLFKEIFALIKE